MKTCSCKGRRWVNDENWEAPYGLLTERRPGAGLIPCGFCNHGGWGVPENEPIDPLDLGPMDQIDHLREEEGAAVTICCDNPEAESADTQTAIDVVGSWTGWRERRFLGRDVPDCLDKAVAAMKEATNAGT